jgi:hypothetical protein
MVNSKEKVVVMPVENWSGLGFRIHLDILTNKVLS